MNRGRRRMRAELLVRWSALFSLLACVGCQSTHQRGGTTERPQVGPEAGSDRGSRSRDRDSSPGRPQLDPVYARGVTYAEEGDEQIRGYLVTPDDDGTHPGVVVVHDWWGLTDDVRRRARRLADEDFTVLAVDLYGGRIGRSPGRARELMREMRGAPDRAVAHLRSAASFLRERTGNASVGVLGWGPGAEIAMRAMTGPEGGFDAGVLYYGRIGRDGDDAAAASGPILGIYGAEDDAIELDEVDSVRRGLRTRGGDESRVRVFEGVEHGFASRSSSTYDADAARRALDESVAFLAEHLSETD